MHNSVCGTSSAKTIHTHAILAQAVIRHAQEALLSTVVIYYIAAVCMSAGEQAFVSTTYFSVAAASSVADSTLHPLQRTLSTLHRLQAYELNGVIAFGPASAAVAQQALTAELVALITPRVLSTQSSATQFIRKCAIVQWQNLLMGAAEVNDFLSNAGTTLAGLIVLLPSDWQREKSEQVEIFRQVELSLLQSASIASSDSGSSLISSAIKIPIFFAALDDGWQQLYDELPKPFSAGMDSLSARPPSVVSTLAQQLTRNTYHLQTVGPQTKVTEICKTVSLLAKVSADGVEKQQQKQRPIVLFVSYYDTAGLAPTLQPQALNAGGSGIAALAYIVELIKRSLDLLRKEYVANQNNTDATIASQREQVLMDYEFWFMFSAFGKQHNYLGSKNWIEAITLANSGSKTAKLPTSNIEQFPSLSRIHHVLCIDGVGTSETLFVHVSKPAKVGTPQQIITDALRDECSGGGADNNDVVVHKKINLANDQLAWEHERFAVSGRIPALTVSQYKSWNDAERRCGLTDQNVDPLVIAHNARRIVRATFRSLLTTASNNAQEKNVDELSSTVDKLLQQVPDDDTIVRKSISLLRTTQRSSQLIGSSRSNNKKSADSDEELSLFMRRLKAVLQPVASSLHIISEKLTAPSSAKGAQASTDPQFYEPLTYDDVRVVRGKHAVFDVMLACLAAGYVGVVFAAFKFVLSQRAYAEPMATVLAKPFKILFDNSSTASSSSPVKTATITTKSDTASKRKVVQAHEQSSVAASRSPPVQRDNSGKIRAEGRTDGTVTVETKVARTVAAVNVASAGGDKQQGSFKQRTVGSSKRRE